jgi:hypothetical protein
MADEPSAKSAADPEQLAQVIRTKLAKGEPVRFKPDDPTELRTIQASWLKEAVRKGLAVDLRNGIVEGPLKLKYATAEQEVRIVDCEIKARADLSYAKFKRNVYLTNTRFREGMNFDSAVFDNDLFMNGVKTTHDLASANLTDANVGGNLFCDSAQFDGPVEFQNLHVKSDAFFRATIFNGSASFLDMKLEGSLCFGSNPSQTLIGAAFNAEADFDGMQVGSTADFEEVRFDDQSTRVGFAGTKIAGNATFSGAAFAGRVNFAHSTIGGQARFHGTIFKGRAIFNGLSVNRSMLFAADTSRNLPASRFEQRADFVDLQGGSNVDFSEVRFECDEPGAEIHYDRARIAGNARFRGSTFSSKAIFTNAQIGGQASFDNARFKKDAIFFGLRVLGIALFRKATFEAQTKFQGTHFSESASFQRSRFKQNAAFARMRVDGNAFFSSEEAPEDSAAIFEAESDFTDASIGGNVEFQAVKFGGLPNFDSVRVEKSGFFQEALFENGADFTGLRIGQDAVFDRAEFRTATIAHASSAESSAVAGGETQSSSTGVVTFQGASIISDAHFGGVLFIADTSFEDAIFHGGGYFDSAIFRRGSLPSFSGAHFRHGAFFRNATFQDVANFRVTRFELEARFQGAKFHKRAIFDGAVFEGIAEFRSGEHQGKALQGAVFSDLSFEHARFEQDARFDGTVFRKPAGFRETSFKALYLSPDGCTGKKAQFRQSIDLRGCQYDRIQADWEALLQIQDKKPKWLPAIWKWSILLPHGLPRQQPYDRQPYIQLEKVLRSSGRTEEADHVYLEQRQVERRQRWQRRQYGRWFTDLVFGCVARYGVRPFRLAVFSILLVVIGARFFSKPGTLLPSKDNEISRIDYRDGLPISGAFAVSLHQFLPVDVPMGAEWVPAALPVSVDFRMPGMIERGLRHLRLGWLARTLQYSLTPTTVASVVLRLPGWILVPLGVASLAGVLRRSPS